MLQANNLSGSRLISAIITLILIGSSALGAQSKTERPNVVVVMTDDQGYPELSAHGNPILQTPHLDGMHQRGCRLTNFHVAPMCAPTRGQLLTGLDAARNGAINVSSGRALLRPELPTMGDLYAQAGYATGIFGKWHLGANYPFRPEDRGFQKTVWFPSSHIGSVPDFWGNDYFDDTYISDGQHKTFEGYCTDVFFEEALRFMKTSAAEGKPFLAYIAPNTPHGPLRAKPQDQAVLTEQLKSPQFSQMKPELKKQLAQYLGMVRNIDSNMGRLFHFLQEHDLRDNTIVVFLTDNGSTHGPRYFNAGMRGQKTQIWEGGHRVPCFFSWPRGGLDQGKDIDGLTQVQDLLPTLLDLCDLPQTANSQFDGMNLAPALRGEKRVPDERTLIINYSRMPNFINYPTPFSQSIMTRNQAAVLWKRWRLLEDRELYNLETDPRQQNNVFQQHPEIVQTMRKPLYDWWSEVGPKANEPQRIVIGNDRENPTRLTACEWLDVFVDQQRQIRQGIQKSGYWLLEVDQAGTYEFELRRWPRELNQPIPAGLSSGESKALPINKAHFFLSQHHHLDIGQKRPYGFEGLTKKIKPEDASVTFTAELTKGPVALHTWFQGKDTMLSAYYVYVTRK